MKNKLSQLLHIGDGSALLKLLSDGYRFPDAYITEVEIKILGEKGLNLFEKDYDLDTILMLYHEIEDACFDQEQYDLSEKMSFHSIHMLQKHMQNNPADRAATILYGQAFYHRAKNLLKLKEYKNAKHLYEQALAVLNEAIDDKQKSYNYILIDIEDSLERIALESIYLPPDSAEKTPSKIEQDYLYLEELQKLKQNANNERSRTAHSYEIFQHLEEMIEDYGEDEDFQDLEKIQQFKVREMQELIKSEFIQVGTLKEICMTCDYDVKFRSKNEQEKKELVQIANQAMERVMKIEPDMLSSRKLEEYREQIKGN